MLGDGGLSQRELLHQLAAHARFAFGQDPQDLDSCRVTDSLRKSSQFLGGCLPYERATTINRGRGTEASSTRVGGGFLHRYLTIVETAHPVKAA